MGVGDGIEVTELRNPTEEQKEEFIAASVAGYRDGGRKEELLGLLARLATVRGDTGLFVARRVKGGEEEAVVVGCAALGVLGSGDGAGKGQGERVGHLYLDSTVPGYRGIGVHGALIRARLNKCRDLGLRVVTLATGVGGGSARNVERERGFSWDIGRWFGFMISLCWLMLDSDRWGLILGVLLMTVSILGGWWGQIGRYWLNAKLVLPVP